MQAINEGKRKKDLVERYKKQRVLDGTVAGSIKKMSLHSTFKKTLRFNQKIVNKSQSCFFRLFLFMSLFILY